VTYAPIVLPSFTTPVEAASSYAFMATGMSC
jgi:hypothetical protein